MANGQPLTATLPQQTNAPSTLLECDSELVGVLVAHDHRRLVAIRGIAKGTHVFTISGRETAVPTRYSLQVGATLHLDQDCARDEYDLVRRFFWRYLDHACEPSTVIRNREVIALRDIAEGEGVTFDYNTTEYDMASPFHCHCGSARCVGLIRGAKHLTRAQRARRERWLPDYLR